MCKRLFPSAILALIATLCFLPTLALADMIAPPAMPTRMAAMDLVVVGHVLAILDQDQQVLPYPTSTRKVPYRIAVVKVVEPIHGVKKKTKIIKIGYPAPVRPQPGQPVLSSRGYGIQLQPGQGGVFLLQKHHNAAFFVAPNMFHFIRSNNSKYYKQQLARIKHLAKLAANPMAGLKSKNPQDRLDTAALLITKYRTPPRVRPLKTMPIPAKESQLILNVLKQAEWTNRRFVPGRNEMPVSPQQLFAQLGIGAADGFKVPRGQPNGYVLAARAWLGKNADTYRIQRFARPQK